jgi:hypothetical protein
MVKVLGALAQPVSQRLNVSTHVITVVTGLCFHKSRSERDYLVHSYSHNVVAKKV